MMSKQRRGFHITSVRSEPINQSESSTRRPQSHDAVGHRFRVVRLDTRGRYQRGRWTCVDLPTTEVASLGAGLRRVMMIDSLRHAHSLESLEMIGRERDKGTGFVVLSGPPSPTMHQCDPAPPKPRPLQLLTDAQTLRQCRSQPSSPPHSLNLSHALFSPTHSASCSSSIDNKIEQALDLVKTHLRMAVRDEVQVLRETIRDLQTQNQLLQQENRILRAFTRTGPGLEQD
ncbi:sperm acrosome developmental regulator-like isoform X1 [Periophthalmus magnuspinnatus]|uniref:sperm acrosome developmental regulator-like isoform X1 n=1 Tax=Periophthalmus magnuspinnatus TaxID=409849 RepID=UPI00243680AC|nr:sperm acrosome developmental regulator-like isoform X1 [Periophthalmus magnuspinnatus]